MDELLARHGVPGAAVAVLHGDELIQAASGVVNARTGVATTVDTVFQIGSITKVLTATLVMQLVDEGRIDLDEPVTAYVPDLRFGDPGADPTTRQFLTHTSGLEGDYFEDFGRGEDAIARYVAALSNLPQLHPPGENFSYCNSGWVVLGHLLEQMHGQHFHSILASRLTVPASLHDTMLLPEEALLRRVAVGHLDDPASGRPVVASRWTLGHSTAPAGSLTCATAADVVRFAKLHLDGGRGPDGTTILSVEAVKSMQQPQAEVPDPYTFGPWWGLGWFLMQWDGRSVIGHDGVTIGQAAFLRVCPDAGLAVALLTNGGAARGVYHSLFAEVFQAAAGIHMPAPLVPLGQPVQDAQRLAGRFIRHDVTVDVASRDGELWLHTAYHGHLTDLLPPPKPARLLPAGRDVFLTEVRGTLSPVVFYAPSGDGRPQWLHMGACAHRRTSEGYPA